MSNTHVILGEGQLDVLERITKRNKLVVIGWMGVKTCYLNVPVAEAVYRWEAANGQIDEGMVNDGFIAEFDITDEFDAYDASGCFDKRRVYNRNGERIDE